MATSAAYPAYLQNLPVETEEDVKRTASKLKRYHPFKDEMDKRKDSEKELHRAYSLISDAVSKEVTDDDRIKTYKIIEDIQKQRKQRKQLSNLSSMKSILFSIAVAVVLLSSLISVSILVSLCSHQIKANKNFLNFTHRARRLADDMELAERGGNRDGPRGVCNQAFDPSPDGDGSGALDQANQASGGGEPSDSTAAASSQPWWVTHRKKLIVGGVTAAVVTGVAVTLGVGLGLGLPRGGGGGNGTATTAPPTTNSTNHSTTASPSTATSVTPLPTRVQSTTVAAVTRMQDEGVEQDVTVNGEGTTQDGASKKGTSPGIGDKRRRRRRADD